MGERRGTKALELWCRRMTEGYPGVKIENMTTSWRDGLAFCAMIHHFRPDLIEFEKLNKNDVYYNNDLAFSTAERHLGIPALLDADDMASYEVPDRLSILTYLSQFYQVFASPDSHNRLSNKRPSAVAEKASIAKPTGPPPKMAHIVGVPKRDPCQKCGLPVFLAERLMIGKNVYHRTCLRCARCNSQLTPGNFYETEIDGEYCCETCPDEEKKLDVATSSKDRALELVKPIAARLAFFEKDGTKVLQKSLSDEEKSQSLKKFTENQLQYIYKPNSARSSFLNNPSSGEYDSRNSSRRNSDSSTDTTSSDKTNNDVSKEPPELPKSLPPLLSEDETHASSSFHIQESTISTIEHDNKTTPKVPHLQNIQVETVISEMSSVEQVPSPEPSVVDPHKSESKIKSVEIENDIAGAIPKQERKIKTYIYDDTFSNRNTSIHSLEPSIIRNKGGANIETNSSILTTENEEATDIKRYAFEETPQQIGISDMRNQIDMCGEQQIKNPNIEGVQIENHILSQEPSVVTEFKDSMDFKSQDSLKSGFKFKNIENICRSESLEIKPSTEDVDITGNKNDIEIPQKIQIPNMRNIKLETEIYDLTLPSRKALEALEPCTNRFRSGEVGEEIHSKDNNSENLDIQVIPCGSEYSHSMDLKSQEIIDRSQFLETKPCMLTTENVEATVIKNDISREIPLVKKIKLETDICGEHTKLGILFVEEEPSRASSKKCSVLSIDKIETENPKLSTRPFDQQQDNSVEFSNDLNLIKHSINVTKDNSENDGEMRTINVPTTSESIRELPTTDPEQPVVDSESSKSMVRTRLHQFEDIANKSQNSSISSLSKNRLSHSANSSRTSNVNCPQSHEKELCTINLEIVNDCPATDSISNEMEKHASCTLTENKSENQSHSSEDNMKSRLDELYELDKSKKLHELDKSDASDKTEKPDNLDELEKSDISDKLDASDKSENPDNLDELEKSDTSDKLDASDKSEKPDNLDELEKSNTSDNLDASDKSEKPDNLDELEKSNTSDKLDASEKSEKPDNLAELEKSDAFDKSDKLDNLDKLEKKEEVQKKKSDDYPEELNPFKSDEEEDNQSSPRKTNPFESSDEDETINKAKVTHSNPFGSESEDDNVSSRSGKLPVPTPRITKSSEKFQPAVTQMTMWRECEETLHNTQDCCGAVRLDQYQDVRSSIKSTHCTSCVRGVTKNRKKKPAPQPPKVSKEIFSPINQDSKKSSPGSSTASTPTTMRKKRPAPSPPGQSKTDGCLQGKSDLLLTSMETASTAQEKVKTEKPQAQLEKLCDEEKVLLESSTNICSNESSSTTLDKINESTKTSKRRLIALDASLVEDANSSEDLKLKEEDNVVYRRILVPPVLDDPTLSPSSDTSESHDRQLEKMKDNKEAKNRNRQSQISLPSEENDPLYNKSVHGKWKRRKGPAPALPVPPKKVLQMLPLQEIRHELEIIEVQQQGLEKQGVMLEKMIRERCEGPAGGDNIEGSPNPPNSKEVEDLILQLFELVNEKNELFRRQAELMYLRRQHRLEQEQADLEYEIRVLMAQPERNKTDSDKAREEALIARLVEVVQLRNEVVECLEMDRLREAEEDLSIKQRLEMHSAKRDEELSKQTPTKLSKKEKKKQKEHKKIGKSKKLDADKDADESELNAEKLKAKKKKKKFLF